MMIHIQGHQSESRLTNVHAEDIQPNAVDLRVDRVMRIGSGRFVLGKETKTHRHYSTEMPYMHGEGEWWELYPGHYEIVMENIIEVGPSEAGFVITRSTLNRNGCYLTSGLYDSGYNGAMAAALHVTCGSMHLERGARVGQYVNFQAEALDSYKGSYGFNSDGSLKKDEVKYHSNASTTVEV